MSALAWLIGGCAPAGDAEPENFHGDPPLACPERKVFEGTMYFRGDSATGDAAAFCDTYNATSSGVTVWETDWLDLSPLACLCETGTWFTATENASLASLAGLDHLAKVGSFNLYDNALLTSLEGLTDIPEVGDWAFRKSEGLASLDGFPSSAPSGDVELQWLPNLQDFSAMEEWTSVWGSILLEDLPYFDDLSPLENLESVDQLQMFDLPIRSFEGLDSLELVDYLKVADSPEFESLVGFPSSLDLRYLVLSDLGSLATLKGLPGGFTLPNLVIEGTLLTDLSGLDNVDGLEALALFYNWSLLSVDGLPASLTTIGDWSIHDNRLLADLEGLSGITQVDDLHITGSNAITSIAGLRNVRQVGKMNIQDLALLTDLSPLYGVEDIDGYIWIDECDLITEQDCDELEAVLENSGAATYREVDCSWF